MGYNVHKCVKMNIAIVDRKDIYMARSIEEKVEEHYKRILDNVGLRHFAKTEKINDSIENALHAADSKSGGSGSNYPDIKSLVDNRRGRVIPVMIECKGLPGKLEKLSKEGDIVGITYSKDGKPNHSAVTSFAVNGALHYGKAILEGSTYDEVIIIGVNGTTIDDNGHVTDPEHKTYTYRRRTIAYLSLSTGWMTNGLC